ncbi:hypothetical protein M2146_001103 [Lachnospiraceae bacterium PF1-22]
MIENETKKTEELIDGIIECFKPSLIPGVEIKKIRKDLSALFNEDSNANSKKKVRIPDETLALLLEDDDTEFGGISRVGETLEDFIAESETLNYFSSLAEVNSALIECGIRPICVDKFCENEIVKGIKEMCKDKLYKTRRNSMVVKFLDNNDFLFFQIYNEEICKVISKEVAEPVEMKFYYDYEVHIQKINKERKSASA